MFNNQFTYVHGGFFLDYQDVPPQGNCATRAAYTERATYASGSRARAPDCLWNIQSLLNRTTGVTSRSLVSAVPDVAPDLGSQDRRHLLPDAHARRRPQPEVRPRLTARRRS